MADKPALQINDLAGIALVIVTAFLGGGVLYAVLYAASVYVWR
jgi:hypothetical protein